MTELDPGVSRARIVVSRGVTECEMASSEVVMARRHAAAEWIAKPGGLGHHNIRRFAKEHGISVGTAWRDRRAALDWMAEHAGDVEPTTAEDLLLQLDTTIELAHEEGDRKAALTGLKLKADILGLNAPKQVDVTVKDEAHGVSSLPAQALDVLMVVLGRLEAGTLTGEELGALRVLGFQAAGELGAPEVIDAEVIEER